MWIGEDQLRLRFRHRIASPYLCPAQKETLCGCKAIDGLPFLELLRMCESLVSNIQTAKISEIFSQRKAAIHMNCIEHSKIIILVHYLRRSLAEFVCVFF